MSERIRQHYRKAYWIVLILVIARFGLVFVYQECDTDMQQQIYSFTKDFYIDWILSGISLVAFILLLLDITHGVSPFVKLLISFGILWIIGSIILASLNTARRKDPDARRVGDIMQLRTSLEWYFDDNHLRYPSNLSGLVPTYVPIFPKDPTGADYDYAVSVDGKKYVLRAVTSRPKSCYQRIYGSFSPLNNDLDGMVLGLDCNDPAYCYGN